MKIFNIVYSTRDDEDEEEEDFEENIFKISDPYFVEKNKYVYKIIYKNKIYPLQSIFKIIDNKFEKLKIKLICYNYISDINKRKNDFQS